MNHSKRVAMIARALRTAQCGPGWRPVGIARVGTVHVNRVTRGAVRNYQIPEIWVLIGGSTPDTCESEMRGSAEDVARQLCLRLAPPSKLVADAIGVIQRNSTRAISAGRCGIEGLRVPEISAWLALTEDAAQRAVDYLEEMGLGTMTEGGWVHTEVDLPQPVPVVPQATIDTGCRSITLTLPTEARDLRGTLDCKVMGTLLKAAREALDGGDSLSLKELLSEALARVMLHRAV